MKLGKFSEMLRDARKQATHYAGLVRKDNENDPTLCLMIGMYVVHLFLMNQASVGFKYGSKEGAEYIKNALKSLEQDCLTAWADEELKVNIEAAKARA